MMHDAGAVLIRSLMGITLVSSDYMEGMRDMTTISTMEANTHLPVVLSEHERALGLTSGSVAYVLSKSQRDSRGMLHVPTNSPAVASAVARRIIGDAAEYVGLDMREWVVFA